MAVLGDRSVAGLLSALAEAPDFAAAASFLLTQLVEITAASRACMLRVDEAQEALVVVAAAGFDENQPEFGIPLVDLSSPLVLSALSLAPVRGKARLAQRALASFEDWVALPMSQPRFRGAPETMSEQRAAELLSSSSVTLIASGEHRLGVAPAGVVLFEAPADGEPIDQAMDLLALASPVIARL